MRQKSLETTAHIKHISDQQFTDVGIYLNSYQQNNLS